MLAVLTFSRINRTQIISTLAQLAHDELFKIMISSFSFHWKQLKLIITRFKLSFNPVGKELYNNPN